MDLLRIIKIKQLNGDLDNLNEKEKFFISLFNNLVEHKEESAKSVYYTSPNYDFYFRLDMHNILWCSRINVFDVIKNKFNYTKTAQVDSFIALTLKKLSINIAITNIQDAEPAILKRYLNYPQ